MLSWLFVLKPLDYPIKSLITLFVAWKSVLLLIAACSPGAGYDTSTTLALPYEITSDTEFPHLLYFLKLFTEKLTRWDAIYFTTTAGRGYLYEQEWAFGWFSWLINFFSDGDTLAYAITPDQTD
jgi:phosphatidylinositol glycan class V